MNMLAPIAPETRARAITHSTRGHGHGSITRLVSPSDIGELIKPFVFLDYYCWAAALPAMRKSLR